MIKFCISLLFRNKKIITEIQDLVITGMVVVVFTWDIYWFRKSLENK